MKADEGVKSIEKTRNDINKITDNVNEFIGIL